jgi:hypothetical protein
MSKAFRNTGIEGGYGTLAFQKMLWGAENSAKHRADRTGDSSLKWKSISAVKEKPVKQETSWNFRPDMDQRALLIKYAEAEGPAFCGSWNVSVKLWGRGLIELVRPPARWASNGAKAQPTGYGALFEITQRGREYLDWLKAKS